MSRGGWPVVFARKPLGVRVRSGVLRGYLCGGGHILKNFIYVVEMGN